jgi:dimethylamine corrinoid protein
MEKLITLLLDGDQEKAIIEANKLNEGHNLDLIVKDGIEEAMKQLDARCTTQQYNLLEIMLCGRAVIGVMNNLFPPDINPPETKATIIVGALEGDIHDLGKNIFKMALNANGYRTVDCGKDCPTENLINAAVKEGAVAIGVSALLTTVIPQLRQVKNSALKHGEIKIIAGGGALQQASAESLNVDFLGQTVFEGIHYLDRLMEVKR